VADPRAAPPREVDDARAAIVFRVDAWTSRDTQHPETVRDLGLADALAEFEAAIRADERLRGSPTPEQDAEPTRGNADGFVWAPADDKRWIEIRQAAGAWSEGYARTLAKIAVLLHRAQAGPFAGRGGAPAEATDAERLAEAMWAALHPGTDMRGWPSNREAWTQAMLRAIQGSSEPEEGRTT
jgi:hypothetical protein